MINFIVVDDNKKFLDIIFGVITKVMMKNKFVYKTYLFNEYDNDFIDVMNKPLSNKIYIMDIETPLSSGIDMARKIRRKDIDSIIIFVTVHNEAGLILLKDDLMFLTFICKFDDFENKLETSISKALEYTHHRAIIKFTDRGTIYTIPLHDILYVTKETNDRKCIIKTANNEYRVGLSLKEIVNLCGKNLVQTHRSCYVNRSRIVVVDRKNKKIEFDDGSTCDLLSSMYKKGLSVCD
ncbi:MAG: LytTR family transcriptional regulator DNA-binding domain-containing protein [Bacilli bacterium]|nr:LytTR family transcriptional regulator DNA-binding domain-containing protein [Bacilli bacterium]